MTVPKSIEAAKHLKFQGPAAMPYHGHVTISWHASGTFVYPFRANPLRRPQTR